MSVFILSHNDLDGYISAYFSLLHARALGYTDEQIDIWNIGYNEITDALNRQDILDMEAIFITDLNFKPDQYQRLEMIVSQSHKLQYLFFADHHIHGDDVKLSDLEIRIQGQTSARIQFMCDANACASILALNQYSCQFESTLSDESSVLAQYVDCHDRFVRNEGNDFEIGRFLNHKFSRMRSKLNSISDLNDPVLRRRIVELIGTTLMYLSTCINGNGSKGAQTQKDAAIILEMHGAQVYGAGLKEIDEELADKLIPYCKDYASDEIMDVMIAAFATLGDVEAVSYFTYGNYEGLIFKKPVGMDIVYHLIHTIDYVDFAAVFHPGDRVEMRQNRHSRLLLNKLVERFGGGGHPDAAGFPLKDGVDAVKDELINTMQLAGDLK